LAADEVDKQYGGGKGIGMTKFTQFTSGPSPKSNSERSQIRKEEITKERLKILFLEIVQVTTKRLYNFE
jgi:hypothetical protein